MKLQSLSVCLVSIICLFASTAPIVAQQKSIAQTASDAGIFNTLVAAVGAANLVGGYGYQWSRRAYVVDDFQHAGSCWEFYQ